MKIIAYTRVSTAGQGHRDAGLEAQRAAVAAEVERRGWELVETFEDRGFSARDLKRPASKRRSKPSERGRHRRWWSPSSTVSLGRCWTLPP